MASAKYRAVHYINQFFGQIGGEEKADTGFSVKPGVLGPGMLLRKNLGDEVEVVATVICGDNYFAANTEEASRELLALVAPHAPDIFFAGPAFGSGRYGIACGAACKAVSAAMKIPCVSGMHEENPGMEAYRANAYIAKTHSSAAKMSEAAAAMTRIGKKLLHNTHGRLFLTGFGIGTPEEEGYFPQLVVRNLFAEENAARRAVNMLLAKISGRPFKTEMPFTESEVIAPAEPVGDMGKCRVAVVSDGALVDRDNSPKLKTRNCDVWGKFNLHEFFAPGKSAGDYRVVHTGYHHVHILNDRNRMVPYDVLVEMEKEGKIGVLHPTYYVTCGNAGIARWSARMGREIAGELVRDKVDAVILTSA
jgi:glycine reductase